MCNQPPQTATALTFVDMFLKTDLFECQKSAKKKSVTNDISGRDGNTSSSFAGGMEKAGQNYERFPQSWQKPLKH